MLNLSKNEYGGHGDDGIALIKIRRFCAGMFTWGREKDLDGYTQYGLRSDMHEKHPFLPLRKNEK